MLNVEFSLKHAGSINVDKFILKAGTKPAVYSPSDYVVKVCVSVVCIEIVLMSGFSAVCRLTAWLKFASASDSSMRYWHSHTDMLNDVAIWTE